MIQTVLRSFTDNTPTHSSSANSSDKERDSSGQRRRSSAKFRPPDQPPARESWVPDTQHDVCMVCRRERFTMVSQQNNLNRGVTKTVSCERPGVVLGSNSQQNSSPEQSSGDSGKKQLPLNRKKLPPGPGSGWAAICLDLLELESPVEPHIPLVLLCTRQACTKYVPGINLVYTKYGPGTFYIPGTCFVCTWYVPDINLPHTRYFIWAHFVLTLYVGGTVFSGI